MICRHMHKQFAYFENSGPLMSLFHLLLIQQYIKVMMNVEWTCMVNMECMKEAQIEFSIEFADC